jgi:hypothetical protein
MAIPYIRVSLERGACVSPLSPGKLVSLIAGNLKLSMCFFRNPPVVIGVFITLLRSNHERNDFVGSCTTGTLSQNRGGEPC